MPLGSGRRRVLSDEDANKEIPAMVDGKAEYRKLADCGLVIMLTGEHSKKVAVQQPDGTSVNVLRDHYMIGNPGIWGRVAAINLAARASRNSHSISPKEIHKIVCNLVDAVSELEVPDGFLWDGEKTGMDEYLKTGKGIKPGPAFIHLSNVERLLNSGAYNTDLPEREISSVIPQTTRTAHSIN